MQLRHRNAAEPKATDTSQETDAGMASDAGPRKKADYLSGEAYFAPGGILDALRRPKERNVGEGDPGPEMCLVPSRAKPHADGTIVTAQGTLGPFVGEWEGRPRAVIIAERLEHAASSFGDAVASLDGGTWSVKVGSAAFSVKEQDASAAGFASARIAAWEFASRLSGKPIPDDVASGKKPGLLNRADDDAITAYRRSTAVQANINGSILAHGVSLGPFVGSWQGRPRAEIIAERLAKVPSSAFRGATAFGNEVHVGTERFSLTDEDAKAQGHATAAEAAKAAAGKVDGTWVKGAYKQCGRRVMPAAMDGAVLFEFARAVAEGPGHTSVSVDPGQVTVVGLRGVNMDGVYDPQLKAADDTIVALVIDRQGSRKAVKLKGTVDPGGSSGGATQVGDATAEFYYSNYSGKRALKGTTLLRPVDGIEGKDLNHGVQEYDEMTTGADRQGATLIHLGTAASESRGCTVIIDKGKYDTNKTELKNLYDLGIEQLDPETLNMNAGKLAAAVELERAKESPDKRRIHRMEGLLELRRLEEASSAKTAGNEQESVRQRAALSGDAAPVQGKEYASAEDLATASNFKAFMSIVYRDPEMRVQYTIVDGSKIAEFEP